MVRQIEITLPPYSRGFHLIGKEIRNRLQDLPEASILHLFIKHTSAALAVNEGADPDVRIDLEAIF